MKTELKKRIRVEINLDALLNNYRKIAARAKPAGVLCVVKANAYGLGVEQYASVLGKTDCTGFGVADPFEALELLDILTRKRIRKDVQILSSILPDEIAPMVAAGVILPVIDLKTAELISAAAVRLRKTARVHIKLDTGMGRLGILFDRANEVIRAVKKLPNLDVEGIFSHFPVASNPQDPYTKVQIARFKAVLAQAKKDGIAFRKVHIAASDATSNFPECARAPFTQVRAGIDLHGSFDPNGRRVLKVENVVSLKARIAQVRDLPAGTTLGYGRTWCLREPTRIATVAAGYADGLPLALTNRGRVLIDGKFCPIVGRISMDYTTVDVSQVPDVKPGDDVVFFGASGKSAIAPDEWAALKGTHAYDIICSLSPRVRRVYVGG